MRHFLLFVSISVLALGVYLSFNHLFYPAHSPLVLEKPYDDENQEWVRLAQAEQALHENDLLKASELLNQRSIPANENDELSQKWLEVAIGYHEKIHNIPMLLELYGRYPKSFLKHEKASLLVADALLLQAERSTYKLLRQNWYGKEKHHHGWFILDVDHLLQTGHKQEALDLLHAHSFAGKTDASRLIRLALLYITENPKKAWGYLNEAYVKDPLNPQVRSYRAKLLEAAGKNELALKEFEAAAQIDPSQATFQDQLAEFYLRQQNYAKANAIWQKQLASPTADHFWVKAIFWDKVTTPSKSPWVRKQITMGKYYDLVEYYLRLKPGQFWNQQAFEQIPSSSAYLNHPSTKWLRLVDCLQKGNEAQALSFLESSREEDFAWSPNLYKGLKIILSYRLKHQVEEVHLEIANSDKLHPFFKELYRFETHPERATPQFKALLSTQDIYSIAFLAEGWYEAALQLPHTPSLSKNYPEWIAYTYTLALQANRSPKEALAYAQAQLSSSPLTLLMAKLYMQEHESSQAISILKTISKDQDKHGLQAALFLAQIYTKQKELDKAQSSIWNNEQARLSNNGKEILARIALLENDVTKAIAYYTEIAQDSSEAQSFLAQKAFENEDWMQAKVLTERLLKKNPDNATLQQNLRKILSKLPRE